jgi:hypothetical protein
MDAEDDGFQWEIAGSHIVGGTIRDMCNVTGIFYLSIMKANSSPGWVCFGAVVPGANSTKLIITSLSLEPWIGEVNKVFEKV